MFVPDSTLNPHAPEYVPLAASHSHSVHPPPPDLPHPPYPPPASLYFYPQQVLYPPEFYPNHHRNPIVNPPLVRPPGRRRGRGRRRFNSERNRLENERDGHEEIRGDHDIRHTVIPLKPDGGQTTIMIKNIPYDCSRQEVIAMLDEFCKLENDRPTRNNDDDDDDDEGHHASSSSVVAYDFVYLPIDFRSKRSRGFAFVNFTTAAAVWRFFEAFHLKNCALLPTRSKKIEVVCARIQGNEALIRRYSGSVFDCSTDDYLPALFSPPRDGSGQPVLLTAVGRRRGGRQCASEIAA